MISTQPKLLHSLCYLTIMVSAALHIAYGAEYIQFGSYLEHRDKDHQLYLDNLPLGSYSITIGCYLILACLALRFFLTKRLEQTGELIFWMTNWLNTVFTFATALVEIRNYVFQQQSFSQLGLPLPTNTDFTTPYYLSLADGIFSFVLAFPACCYLVYHANYRLLEFELKSRLWIKAEPQLPQPPARTQ